MINPSHLRVVSAALLIATASALPTLAQRDIPAVADGLVGQSAAQQLSIHGRIQRIDGRTIVLDGARAYNLHPTARVMWVGGHPASRAMLTPGAVVSADVFDASIEIPVVKTIMIQAD